MVARLNTLTTDRVRHGPASRCIYCGSTDNLTDEHILPDGLGGTHVLINGSCRVCADLINREFESYVLRNLFGPFREVFGLQSEKSAKKKRPRPPQKVVLNMRDGSQKTIYPKPDEIRPALLMPILEMPGLITGNWGNQRTWGTFKYPKTPQRPFPEHPDAVSVQLPPLDIMKFTRWIAKTAHAFGSAVLGEGIFEPVLPGIILGDDTSDAFDWVGSLPDETSKKGLYVLGVGIVTRPNGDQYAVSQVRIFGHIRAPAYFVILGPLIGDWPLQTEDDHSIFSSRLQGTTVALPQ